MKPVNKTHTERRNRPKEKLTLPSTQSSEIFARARSYDLSFVKVTHAYLVVRTASFERNMKKKKT